MYIAAGDGNSPEVRIALLQGNGLSMDRMYLDSFSNANAFANQQLLSDLGEVEGSININCNACTLNTRMKGKFGSLDI